LASDAGCRATYQREQLQRIFDLVHLKYLAPMLSSDVLNYLIGESMRSDRTAQQIISQMWKAPVADRAPERLRSTLARARGLLRPTWAAANVGYVRRLAGVYGELRWREKLDVSLASPLGQLTTKRTARNGKSRRYVMSRPFLTQSFADGGQVTASHLRNIIDHLDDYVQS
jgi:hypothetical protein